MSIIAGFQQLANLIRLRPRFFPLGSRDNELFVEPIDMLISQLRAAHITQLVGALESFDIILGLAPALAQALGPARPRLPPSGWTNGPGGADSHDLRAMVSIVFEPRLGPDHGDAIADEPVATMLFDRPTPPTAHRAPPESDEDERELRRLVSVGDSTIDILEEIHFQFDSAILERRSERILDAVAFALADNPSIVSVEIQGHTDNRGSERYNLDLSRRRARAVRTYLLGAGVDPDRLTANGYGESRPLVREQTERAWAANRRVAFVILRRE